MKTRQQAEQLLRGGNQSNSQGVSSTASSSCNAGRPRKRRWQPERLITSTENMSTSSTKHSWTYGEKLNTIYSENAPSDSISAPTLSGQSAGVLQPAPPSLMDLGSALKYLLDNGLPCKSSEYAMAVVLLSTKATLLGFSLAQTYDERINFLRNTWLVKYNPQALSFDGKPV